MSDFMRKEVIRHLEFLKLAGQINAKPEKINPDYLQFAIDSLKTDEAYNLMYEKVDFIEIPEGATNGDMIQAIFPHATIWKTLNDICLYVKGQGDAQVFDWDWWNSPYRKEKEQEW